MGILDLIVGPIGQIIDRLIPDRAANDAAKAELIKMQLQGDLDQLVGQIQVNVAEAQSKSVFVSGWRPFVGWVCGSVFAWDYVIAPMAQFALVAMHSTFDPAKLPVLNAGDMIPVLLGMLGLAGARTYEKINGKDAGH